MRRATEPLESWDLRRQGGAASAGAGDLDSVAVGAGAGGAVATEPLAGGTFPLAVAKREGGAAATGAGDLDSAGGNGERGLAWRRRRSTGAGAAAQLTAGRVLSLRSTGAAAQLSAAACSRCGDRESRRGNLLWNSVRDR